MRRRRTPSKFEWDERKAGVSLAKHGVAFEAAKEVFRNPFAAIEFDSDEAAENGGA